MFISYIGIGCAALACLVCFIIGSAYFIVRKRKNNQREFKESNSAETPNTISDPERTNDTSSSSSIVSNITKSTTTTTTTTSSSGESNKSIIEKTDEEERSPILQSKQTKQHNGSRRGSKSHQKITTNNKTPKTPKLKSTKKESPKITSQDNLQHNNQHQEVNEQQNNNEQENQKQKNEISKNDSKSEISIYSPKKLTHYTDSALRFLTTSNTSLASNPTPNLKTTSNSNNDLSGSSSKMDLKNSKQNLQQQQQQQQQPKQPQDYPPPEPKKQRKTKPEIYDSNGFKIQPTSKWRFSISKPTTHMISSPRVVIDPLANIRVGNDFVLKDVHKEGKIGEGNFAIVYRGVWNGVHVALKACKQKNYWDGFVEEIKVLKTLQHPGVVQVFGITVLGK